MIIADDKMLNSVTLKRVLILITFVIKERNKFNPKFNPARHKSCRKYISRKLMPVAWNLRIWWD